MLAKSSDAALAKLADKDLAAPEDANRRMELADAWWDLAQKEKGEGSNKPGMLDRAGILVSTGVAGSQRAE